MSWAIGFDPNWNRWVGYGVPATCDHPKCSEAIDRGLGYVCGGDVYGGDHGCGLFFCADHLRRSPQRCTRCIHRKPPYQPKPDASEWIAHQFFDESWTDWRAANPGVVAAIMERLQNEQGDLSPTCCADGCNCGKSSDDRGTP